MADNFHFNPSLVSLLPTMHGVRDGKLYFQFVSLSTPGEGGYPQTALDGGYRGQVQMGGVPRPCLDGGYPSKVWRGKDIQPDSCRGSPPVQYNTADGLLDTPRSLYLLRSRRMTFLFDLLFQKFPLWSIQAHIAVGTTFPTSPISRTTARNGALPGTTAKRLYCTMANVGLGTQNVDST